MNGFMAVSGSDISIQMMLSKTIFTIFVAWKLWKYDFFKRERERERERETDRQADREGERETENLGSTDLKYEVFEKE